VLVSDGHRRFHYGTTRPTPSMTRAVRPRARRLPRVPWLTRPAVRRIMVHLVCLGLVCLAAIGPLAPLSGISSRQEVAAAVVREARYRAILDELAAPGGWNVPPYPLTIAEIAASNPPAPALPPAPASIVQPVAEVAAEPAAPPNRAPLTVPIAPNPIREAARDALRQRFASLPEGYGIVVLDADGAPIFEHQPAAQFQAASLYKLGVAAEVYRLRKAGRLSFKDPLIITRESLVDGDTVFAAVDIGRRITIGEAVEIMITHSSNVAAILLLRRVQPASVNATFADLGLNETKLLDRPFRNVHGNAKNQTTPRDMGRFFWLLLRGKVVDVESSQAIITLLLRQRVEDRLPVGLPRGVPIAHKTGNLVGVVHDAGIIYTRNGPVIVVALSQDGPTEEEAVSTIAYLGRATYEAYSGLSASADDEPTATSSAELARP